MNLEFRSFTSAGDLSKERIILKALTDLDVGAFVVFRSGVATSGDDPAPTSGRKIAYWFPDELIKANDLVVLYTKKGSRSSKRLDSGITAYFHYWGREDALWDDPNFGAVVLEVAEWEFRVPKRR